MTASAIRDAVAAARPRLPNLAADYADQAIAVGKTVEAVKGELVDLMLGTGRPASRTMARADMIKQVAARFGGDASASTFTASRRRTDVDPKAAAALTGEPAPAPRSDSRALARANMEEMLRARGVEPAGSARG